ncbi:MAG: hypothetical protein WCK27_24600, partial [Verrucomicrobiota bacterium]
AVGGYAFRRRKQAALTSFGFICPRAKWVAADGSRRTLLAVRESAPTAVGGYAFRRRKQAALTSFRFICPRAK